ncbi:MAG: hypothetical protein ACI9WC_000275 [Arenicella sp.]|jgi:uncharacterized protein (DUF1499 family)
MPKSPNAVSSQAYNIDKHVDALPMTGSTTGTKQRIISCLKQMDGNSVISDNGKLPA